MTTITEPVRAWDFSHVLDLANALGARHDSNGVVTHSDDHRSPEGHHDTAVTGLEERETEDHDAQGGVGLGDFSKVWQFLGTVPPPPQHISCAYSEPQIPEFPKKDDYASDGATYKKNSTAQGRSWQESDGTDGDEPTALPSSQFSLLTKSQRKKARRKARKLLGLTASTGANNAVSESEADHPAKKTPARKASEHFVPTSVLPPTQASAPATEKTDTASITYTTPLKGEASLQNGNSARDPVTAAAENIAPVYSSRPATSSGLPTKVLATQPLILTKQLHTPNTPETTRLQKLVPSSLPPPSRPTFKPYRSEHVLSTPTKPKNIIEPKIVRSGADRHWALLMKIISDFYEDRENLVSPMNMTTHNNDPAGIHIFVDASNIFIGFMDQLKRSRGISQFTHVPEANLSFDALALLMERRRPVAKRTLVGSTPHLPAFDKAKAVGYECSILEKVFKARELTERQKYFKELEAGRIPAGAKAPPSNSVALVQSSGAASPMASSGLYGMGSETTNATTAPQFARAKMIEQGVDEILHLKILESIVDAEVPSTIVLATGDAAAAEYSQGFMAMAERALKKGWTVELVSWSRNINSLYTRKQWTKAWGDRFRIITLDDYAEELLDM